MLYSTSLPLTVVLFPIEENGPMYESSIWHPSPMMAGPRTTLLTIRAPFSITTLPATRRALVHVALDRRREIIEDQPVGLEQVGRLPGVLPPSGDLRIADA